ncbi:unnamed protein product [Spirodela intermedia]|uniref:Uncharacterized protein n=1 Tax=Spirodela intermedia TaxID=51605 RepID=A0A7I8IF66_SPIIN|nr:unnamed protein product [Spirodela intermedia]CAA6655743.1 unnamed protein product [Spirodela intermedia]
METRLAPGGVSVMRPSRLLGSLLISSANAAAKILSAVASSSTVAGHDGERWKAMDHLRYMTMITLWVTIWVLRILMDYLPTFGILPSDATRGVVTAEAGDISPAPPGALDLHGGFGNSAAGPSSTRAIGRALCHVLSLLNDVPITARKYDFVVSTAERILDDNAFSGDATLQQVNREALYSAFFRTCERLRVSLQASRDSEEASATWPSRALCRLPLGSLLASYFNGLLGLLSAVAERPQRLPPPPPGRRRECLESEKLAQELLWIATKMRACGALDGAVVRWSRATRLAALSLTAHPGAQAPWSRSRPPRDVRFRILALWIPLLCYASNGAGSPVLTGWEKRDMEAILGELIQGLPWDDQELILASWMEDFTFSASDWPDLRSCYDRWCLSSRKLLHE